MADDFPRPHPVQLRGSALARWILQQSGWQVEFEGLPARQGVLVVYPHTSNWDFVVLILAKWAVGIELRFWGKDSLFRIPLFGRWLRWVGGVAVDRKSPQGAVGSMVRTLEGCKSSDTYFWLALAPEGTRKRTAGWRSGFYQVAHGANVPLGICSVNFQQKRVTVSTFHRLTGNVTQDMQRIAHALQYAVGKHPAQAAPIRMIEK